LAGKELSTQNNVSGLFIIVPLNDYIIVASIIIIANTNSINCAALHGGE